MTDQKGSRTAGMVLVGAAVLGVIGIAVFSPSATPTVGMTTAAAADSTLVPRQVERPLPIDSAPLIRFERRDQIASPFTEAASDSIASRCGATVRGQREKDNGDTTGVSVVRRFGVRPPPGRGPDSLIVEGTAAGKDTVRAVWHCAATAYPSGAVATLAAVIEDGWPGVGPDFETSHTITLAAEDACLQRTKTVLREFEYRGTRRRRAGDTLHVTGEAMPLNAEDLAADFHCTAVVRGNRVVASSARAGK